MIDAFEPLHRPYELAMAQHRRAAALLTTRTGRAEAGELIAEAHGTALRLGARMLAEDVELLAGHAGLGLPAMSTATEHSETAGEGDADANDHLRSLGLTLREQGVLRLVAAGYSNRRIAAELYIAPKTASAHVSSILGKLGVSSRIEAAAMVHRTHLFTD